MIQALNKTSIRCGTCVHFVDGPAHPQYPKLCQDMGIREYRPAPDCYSPAPLKIVRANVNVSEVGRMLRHLTADQMVVMGQLLTQAAELADYDLKFGQPVYVNLGAGEYLTNYFKGYVVGTVTVDDDDFTQHVFVSSDLSIDQEDAPEFRTLLRLTLDSLNTTKDFNKIKEKLIGQGRLEAPEKSGHRIPLAQWIRMEEKPALPPSEVDAYEPPTIDTAPAAWLDPFSEEDTAHFKVDVKPKKKKGKELLADPHAEAKRLERAKRRLNMVENTDDQGNVYKTISSVELDGEGNPLDGLEGLDELDLDLPADLSPTIAYVVRDLPKPARSY